MPLYSTLPTNYSAASFFNRGDPNAYNPTGGPGQILGGNFDPGTQWDETFRRLGYAGEIRTPTTGGGEQGLSGGGFSPEFADWYEQQGLQVGAQGLGGGSLWAGGDTTAYNLFDKQGNQIEGANPSIVADNVGLRDIAMLAGFAVGGHALGGLAAGAGAGASAGAGTSAGAGASAGTTPAWLSAAGSGAAKGAALGGTSAALQGGNLEDIAKGAAIGGATGGVGAGVSSAAGGGVLGNIAGGAAAAETREAATGGQQGGQTVPQQQTQQSVPWGDIIGGGLGLYGATRARGDTRAELESLRSLYGGNSAYAQQMQQALERKDAAAGRRSQYGTRAVELQARLAENAARLAPTLAGMTTQQSQQRNQQLNNVYGLLKSSGLINKIPGIAQYFQNLGQGMPTDAGISGTPEYNPAFDRSTDLTGVGDYQYPSWAGDTSLYEDEYYG